MEEQIDIFQNESSALLENAPVENSWESENDNIQVESYLKSEASWYNWEPRGFKNSYYQNYKVLLTTRSTTGISNFQNNPFDKERKRIIVEKGGQDDQSFFGPDLFYIFYNDKFIPYEKMIEIVLRDFKFESEEALKFLTKNSSFVSHLVQLSNALTVQEDFENPRFSLDYHFDPEENDEALSIIIKVDLNLNDALKAEKRFFNDYFKSIYLSTNGKLNFRIEPHEL